MGTGAHDHLPGRPRGTQDRVQFGGEGEVAEVVGGQLHLPPGRREDACGERHDPGVRDKNVERPLPGSYEGIARGQAPPVTTARRPEMSTPSITSSAVVREVNGCSGRRVGPPAPS
ncbi:hypothetical protein GCM10010350_82730 [Streptomyces galilaeus]|nr:hypothetical protein GCM10010350_82730 [Streptomyces galilaeus]